MEANKQLVTVLKQCCGAIEGGLVHIDQRGMVYSQEFGEAFLGHIKATIAAAEQAQADNQSEEAAYIKWMCETFPTVYDPPLARLWIEQKHVSFLAWMERAKQPPAQQQAEPVGYAAPAELLALQKGECAAFMYPQPDRHATQPVYAQPPAVAVAVPASWHAAMAFARSALAEAIQIAPLDRLPAMAGAAMQQIDALLAAAPQATAEDSSVVRDAVAVPDGYALVPVEPTAEMLKAADRIEWDDSDVVGNYYNMWNAMIAAAQKGAK